VGARGAVVLIQVLKSSKALLALAPLNLAFDRFSHSMHSIIKFLEHVSDAIECPALERDHETFWILRRRCHDVAINIGPIIHPLFSSDQLHLGAEAPRGFSAVKCHACQKLHDRRYECTVISCIDKMRTNPRSLIIASKFASPAYEPSRGSVPP
jgi:hypothetical protein